MVFIAFIIALVVYFTIGGFFQGIFNLSDHDDECILWLWPIAVPYILAFTAGKKLSKLKYEYKRRKRK